MKIWVTPAEAEAIKHKAKAEGFKHAGQFMSRAIQDAVKGSNQIVINFSPVDMRNLSGVGNSLNQIAKHLNSGGGYLPEMHEDVLYTGKLVKEMGTELYYQLGRSRRGARK